MLHALRIIASIVIGLAGPALIVMAVMFSLGQAMTEQPFDGRFFVMLIPMLALGGAFSAIGVWLGRSRRDGQ